MVESPSFADHNTWTAALYRHQRRRGRLASASNQVEQHPYSALDRRVGQVYMSSGMLTKAALINARLDWAIIHLDGSRFRKSGYIGLSNVSRKPHPSMWTICCCSFPFPTGDLATTLLLHMC
jgi:hypothetical protein